MTPQPVPADCPGIDACGEGASLQSRMTHLEQVVGRDIGSLRETVGALTTAQERMEAEMRASWKGHEVVAAQVAEMKLYVDSQISLQTKTMTEMSGQLSDNTASTERAERLAEQSVQLLQGLHDILATGRVVSRFGKWLADIRKPVSTLALVAALLYGVAKGWAVDVWHGIVATWQAFEDTRMP